MTPSAVQALEGVGPRPSHSRPSPDVRAGDVLLGPVLVDCLTGDEFSPGASGRRLHLPRNHVVYRPGDPAAELYVVESGAVAIARTAPDGRELFIDLIGSGDVFGLCSLFDGGKRATRARALEPSSVVVLSYDSVRRLSEGRPTLTWGLGALVAGRLRRTESALVDSVFLDVTGRTAKYLLAAAGPREEFVLALTQEELAAVVGASRERVNKSLAMFVRLGWIDHHDRRYRIRDRLQLVRRAEVAEQE